MTDIETLVHARVLAMVKLRKPTVAAVRADQELRRDLELDSLDLAQLGSEIEEALGVTVFEDVAIGAVETVNDLVQVCLESPAVKQKAGT